MRVIRAVRIAVAGVTAYLVHDAAGDVALYAVCKREAEALVAHNAEVVAALGEPVHFGPWWDASVTFSRGSNIVTAQYVLRGSRASADLRVGVVRPAGLEKHWTAPSAVLYTALCPSPSPWKVLMCDVTLPGGSRAGSGLPAERVDLLARHAAGTAAVAA